MTADSAGSRPKVYVCVTGQFGSGDVAGTLLLESGEAPWGHVSSSVDWLISDLTHGFTSRREQLEARFPNGYDVILANEEGVIPPEVMKRNEEWYAAQKADSPA